MSVKSSVLKLVAKAIRVSGAKYFTADKASLKEANIGWTDHNFDQYFFGKVEQNVADDTLAVHRLEKRSLDALIRKELDQEREKITLTHFFDLLKKQSKGEEGRLLINGNANMAYICDRSGKLSAVFAIWDSDGRCWDVFASLVGDPGGWSSDCQVICRDC